MCFASKEGVLKRMVFPVVRLMGFELLYGVTQMQVTCPPPPPQPLLTMLANEKSRKKLSTEVLSGLK